MVLKLISLLISFFLLEINWTRFQQFLFKWQGNNQSDLRNNAQHVITI